MSKFVFARYAGLLVLGGLMAASAAGAHAADTAGASAMNEPEVLVSRLARDQRTVRVVISDLDIRSADDRATLDNRIDRAVRQVCQVIHGSAIDRLPSALSCLDGARAGALAQLEARGRAVAATHTLAGGAH